VSDQETVENFHVYCWYIEKQSFERLSEDNEFV
jgi:hypothetical protein